ncbi:hypothetical protein [Spiroplasma endosymbiont of Poecilobothrus nobilitatus]|uniref:hypothetical protein n=1 Tax=Spiroplasma endosymbiont of Poecilobothrus nobilitatus TaxID=1209220 RepID=UPI00313A8B75
MLNKINNALFGTYEYLYYDARGLRKKNWNQKYSDKFIIGCIKDVYFNGLTSFKVGKKYNISPGRVRLWIHYFKYRKGYRFYCEGGISDQLDKIIKVSEYNLKSKNFLKWEKIKEMYLKGCSYLEIKKELNVSDANIEYCVNKFNLPRRRPVIISKNHMW